MSAQTAPVVVPPLTRSLTLAGIAGLAHGALHIAVIAWNNLSGSPEGEITGAPQQMQAEFVAMAAASVLITVIGVLAIIASDGVAAVLRRSGSPLAPAAAALGAAFGISTIAVAASAAAIRGFPNEYILASGADPAAQSAVVEGMFAVTQSLTLLAVLVIAAWWVVTAIAGRGCLPLWLRIVHVVFAVLVVAGIFVAGAIGLLLSTVYFLVLGGWALRTGRRGMMLP